MKTNKLIVMTEEYSCIITPNMKCDIPKEIIIKLLQKDPEFKDTKILDVADANTHHICKYCGDIAKGTDEDVLC